ncbi:MAG: hypothetical protein ACK4VP_01240 [Nitrospira sp.]
MSGCVAVLVIMMVLVPWANGKAQEGDAEIAAPVDSSPARQEPATASERDAVLEQGKEEKMKRGRPGGEGHDGKYHEKEKTKARERKRVSLNSGKQDIAINGVLIRPMKWLANMGTTDEPRPEVATTRSTSKADRLVLPRHINNPPGCIV